MCQLNVAFFSTQLKITNWVIPFLAFTGKIKETSFSEKTYTFSTHLTCKNVNECEYINDFNIVSNVVDAQYSMYSNGDVYFVQMEMVSSLMRTLPIQEFWKAPVKRPRCLL